MNNETFTFSGEHNKTPDECFIYYAVDTYRHRNFTDKEFEDSYSDYFANSPHTENVITDALKSCNEKVKIQKAKVILKKYLNSSKDPLTQSHIIAFGPNNVDKLKKFNVNIIIKK